MGRFTGRKWFFTAANEEVERYVHFPYRSIRSRIALGSMAFAQGPWIPEGNKLWFVTQWVQAMISVTKSYAFVLGQPEGGYSIVYVISSYRMWSFCWLCLAYCLYLTLYGSKLTKAWLFSGCGKYGCAPESVLCVCSSAGSPTGKTSLCSYEENMSCTRKNPASKRFHCERQGNTASRWRTNRLVNG